MLRRSSRSCWIFCVTSSLISAERIIFSMISSCRVMISSRRLLYPGLLFSAKSAASSSRSVTPPRAETTTITGSFSFSMICLTIFKLSGLPTELPPNFITFIPFCFMISEVHRATPFHSVPLCLIRLFRIGGFVKYKMLDCCATNEIIACAAKAAYGCENLPNPPRGHGQCSGSAGICVIQILHCRR